MADGLYRKTDQTSVLDIPNTIFDKAFPDAISSYRKPPPVPMPRAEEYQQQQSIRLEKRWQEIHREHDSESSGFYSRAAEQEKQITQAAYNKAREAYLTYLDQAGFSSLQKARREKTLAEHERRMWKSGKANFLEKDLGDDLSFQVFKWGVIIGAALASGQVIARMLTGYTTSITELGVFCIGGSFILSIFGGGIIAVGMHGWATSYDLRKQKKRASKNVRRLERAQEKARSKEQRMGSVPLIATLITLISWNRGKERGNQNTIVANANAPKIKRDVAHPGTQRLRIAPQTDGQANEGENRVRPGIKNSIPIQVVGHVGSALTTLADEADREAAAMEEAELPSPPQRGAANTSAHATLAHTQRRPSR